MLITENHFHYLIILRYMSRISIHICTLIGNRIKSFIYSVFLLIWQSYSSKNSASRRISDKFLSNIFCQINLYHCLHYRFPIHYNFPDSRLFFPVKIEAKHISFIHMIIFQISNKLLFSSLIIFITMPYLQFNYILLSTIIYNYICSSKISCSGPENVRKASCRRSPSGISRSQLWIISEGLTQNSVHGLLPHIQTDGS